MVYKILNRMCWVLITLTAHLDDSPVTNFNRIRGLGLIPASPQEQNQALFLGDSFDVSTDTMMQDIALPDDFVRRIGADDFQAVVLKIQAVPDTGVG